MGESTVEEKATLAGGCFWCIEAAFLMVRGVSQVTPGYTGGSVPNPTYQQVCSGNTGHAEVVQLIFNPTTVSFQDILLAFFAVHDPTTLNRQGADIGTQYRSAIFCHSESQRQIADNIIRELSNESIWQNLIVTEIKPLEEFYEAEEYHWRYYERNKQAQYCQFVIEPKLAKFRKEQLSLLSKEV